MAGMELSFQMPVGIDGAVRMGFKGAIVQRSAAACVGRQTSGRCDLDARAQAFTYDH